VVMLTAREMRYTDSFPIPNVTELSCAFKVHNTSKVTSFIDKENHHCSIRPFVDHLGDT
jgi:hypothetical protein